MSLLRIFLKARGAAVFCSILSLVLGLGQWVFVETNFAELSPGQSFMVNETVFTLKTVEHTPVLSGVPWYGLEMKEETHCKSVDFCPDLCFRDVGENYVSDCVMESTGRFNCWFETLCRRRNCTRTKKYSVYTTTAKTIYRACIGDTCSDIDDLTVYGVKQTIDELTLVLKDDKLYQRIDIVNDYGACVDIWPNYIAYKDSTFNYASKVLVEYPYYRKENCDTKKDGIFIEEKNMEDAIMLNFVTKYDCCYYETKLLPTTVFIPITTTGVKVTCGNYQYDYQLKSYIETDEIVTDDIFVDDDTLNILTIISYVIMGIAIVIILCVSWRIILLCCLITPVHSIYVNKTITNLGQYKLVVTRNILDAKWLDATKNMKLRALPMENGSLKIVDWEVPFVTTSHSILSNIFMFKGRQCIYKDYNYTTSKIHKDFNHTDIVNGATSMMLDFDYHINKDKFIKSTNDFTLYIDKQHFSFYAPIYSRCKVDGTNKKQGTSKCVIVECEQQKEYCLLGDMLKVENGEIETHKSVSSKMVPIVLSISFLILSIILICIYAIFKCCKKCKSKIIVNKKGDKKIRVQKKSKKEYQQKPYDEELIYLDATLVSNYDTIRFNLKGHTDFSYLTVLCNKNCGIIMYEISRLLDAPVFKKHGHVFAKIPYSNTFRTLSYDQVVFGDLKGVKTEAIVYPTLAYQYSKKYDKYIQKKQRKEMYQMSMLGNITAAQRIGLDSNMTDFGLTAKEYENPATTLTVGEVKELGDILKESYNVRRKDLLEQLLPWMDNWVNMDNDDKVKITLEPEEIQFDYTPIKQFMNRVLVTLKNLNNHIGAINKFEMKDFGVDKYVLVSKACAEFLKEKDYAEFRKKLVAYEVSNDDWFEYGEEIIKIDDTLIKNIIWYHCDTTQVDGATLDLALAGKDAITNRIKIVTANLNKVLNWEKNKTIKPHLTILNVLQYLMMDWTDQIIKSFGKSQTNEFDLIGEVIDKTRLMNDKEKDKKLNNLWKRIQHWFDKAKDWIKNTPVLKQLYNAVTKTFNWFKQIIKRGWECISDFILDHGGRKLINLIYYYYWIWFPQSINNNSVFSALLSVDWSTVQDKVVWVKKENGIVTYFVVINHELGRVMINTETNYVCYDLAQDVADVDALLKDYVKNSKTKGDTGDPTLDALMFNEYGQQVETSDLVDAVLHNVPQIKDSVKNVEIKNVDYSNYSQENGYVTTKNVNSLLLTYSSTYMNFISGLFNEANAQEVDWGVIRKVQNNPNKVMFDKTTQSYYFSEGNGNCSAIPIAGAKNIYCYKDIIRFNLVCYYIYKDQKDKPYKFYQDDNVVVFIEEQETRGGATFWHATFKFPKKHFWISEKGEFLTSIRPPDIKYSIDIYHTQIQNKQVKIELPAIVNKNCNQLFNYYCLTALGFAQQHEFKFLGNDNDRLDWAKQFPTKDFSALKDELGKKDGFTRGCINTVKNPVLPLTKLTDFSCFYFYNRNMWKGNEGMNYESSKVEKVESNEIFLDEYHTKPNAIDDNGVQRTHSKRNHTEKYINNKRKDKINEAKLGKFYHNDSYVIKLDFEEDNTFVIHSLIDTNKVLKLSKNEVKSIYLDDGGLVLHYNPQWVDTYDSDNKIVATEFGKVLKGCSGYNEKFCNLTPRGLLVLAVYKFLLDAGERVTKNADQNIKLAIKYPDIPKSLIFMTTFFAGRNLPMAKIVLPDVILTDIGIKLDEYENPCVIYALEKFYFNFAEYPECPEAFKLFVRNHLYKFWDDWLNNDKFKVCDNLLDGINAVATLINAEIGTKVIFGITNKEVSKVASYMITGVGGRYHLAIKNRKKNKFIDQYGKEIDGGEIFHIIVMRPRAMNKAVQKPVVNQEIQENNESDAKDKTDELNNKKNKIEVVESDEEEQDESESIGDLDTLISVGSDLTNGNLMKVGDGTFKYTNEVKNVDSSEIKKFADVNSIVEQKIKKNKNKIVIKEAEKKNYYKHKNKNKRYVNINLVQQDKLETEKSIEKERRNNKFSETITLLIDGKNVDLPVRITKVEIEPPDVDPNFDIDIVDENPGNVTKFSDRELQNMIDDYAAKDSTKIFCTKPYGIRTDYLADTRHTNIYRLSGKVEKDYSNIDDIKRVESHRREVLKETSCQVYVPIGMKVKFSHVGVLEYSTTFKWKQPAIFKDTNKQSLFGLAKILMDLNKKEGFYFSSYKNMYNTSRKFSDEGVIIRGSRVIMYANDDVYIIGGDKIVNNTNECYKLGGTYIMPKFDYEPVDAKYYEASCAINHVELATETRKNQDENHHPMLHALDSLQKKLLLNKIVADTTEYDKLLDFGTTLSLDKYSYLFYAIEHKAFTGEDVLDNFTGLVRQTDAAIFLNSIYYEQIYDIWNILDCKCYLLYTYIIDPIETSQGTGFYRSNELQDQYGKIKINDPQTLAFLDDGDRQIYLFKAHGDDKPRATTTKMITRLSHMKGQKINISYLLGMALISFATYGNQHQSLCEIDTVVHPYLITRVALSKKIIDNKTAINVITNICKTENNVGRTIYNQVAIYYKFNKNRCNFIIKETMYDDIFDKFGMSADDRAAFIHYMVSANVKDPLEYLCTSMLSDENMTWYKAIMKLITFFLFHNDYDTTVQCALSESKFVCSMGFDLEIDDLSWLHARNVVSILACLRRRFHFEKVWGENDGAWAWVLDFMELFGDVMEDMFLWTANSTMDMFKYFKNVLADLKDDNMQNINDFKKVRQQLIEELDKVMGANTTGVIKKIVDSALTKSTSRNLTNDELQKYQDIFLAVKRGELIAANEVYCKLEPAYKEEYDNLLIRENSLRETLKMLEIGEQNEALVALEEVENKIKNNQYFKWKKMLDLCNLKEGRSAHIDLTAIKTVVPKSQYKIIELMDRYDKLAAKIVATDLVKGLVNKLTPEDQQNIEIQVQDNRLVVHVDEPDAPVALKMLNYGITGYKAIKINDPTTKVITRDTVNRLMYYQDEGSRKKKQKLHRFMKQHYDILQLQEYAANYDVREYLKHLKSDKKSKGIEYYMKILTGEIIYATNAYEVLPKRNEIIIGDEMKNGRIVCSPTETIKFIYGLIAHLLEKYMIENNPSFTPGKTIQETAELIEQDKLTMTDPWYVDMDGSKFDSTQYTWILREVDKYFVSAVFEVLCQNFPALSWFKDMVFSDLSTLILVHNNLTYLLDTKVINETFYLEGKTLSGNALLTTFGNTMRSIIYRQFICAEMNIPSDHYKIYAAGDDCVMLISNQYVHAVPEIMHRTEDFFRQNIKEFHVSKHEYNFCSCQIIDGKVKKEVSHTLLKNFTFSNENVELIKQAKAYNFTRWFYDSQLMFDTYNHLFGGVPKHKVEANVGFYNSVSKDINHVDETTFTSTELVITELVNGIKSPQNYKIYKKTNVYERQMQIDMNIDDNQLLVDNILYDEKDIVWLEDNDPVTFNYKLENETLFTENDFSKRRKIKNELSKDEVDKNRKISFRDKKYNKNNAKYMPRMGKFNVTSYNLSVINRILLESPHSFNIYMGKILPQIHKDRIELFKDIICNVENPPQLLCQDFYKNYHDFKHCVK